jgi:hypothetical protein
LGKFVVVVIETVIAIAAVPAIEEEFEVSRVLLSQSMAFYLAVFAFSTFGWIPLPNP